MEPSQLRLLRFTRDHNHNANTTSGSVTETTPFLPPGQNQAAAGQRAHLIKSVLYALQNFHAFMLM